MAGENQEIPWPVPKFFFSVTFEDQGEIAFQEVSGLDTEYDPIEYRDGNSIVFSTVKMPGLKKQSDVTLKKGMFKDDKKLFQYFASVVMNKIKRQTVTISLMDQDKSALFTWKLKNAWPLKYTGTDLNAQNSEVAIEELVLAHEELTME
ncbi:MAG: phage tail protein [Saprospiraceae bacterium]|nr:phage tail protein [Saprospiraceae bacterium]MCB0622802.1 phage tail protein [Saprospiraceae bacterium]MCB0675234.1 phage tail protein [Saprospiraceae bacterium]MCB0681780.1 phage tail protein [Saprospiraceae bacterium]